MKHAKKIIAMFIILLIVLTVQAPQASAPNVVTGTISLLQSIGQMLGSTAKWIGDAASGKKDVAEGLGTLISGTITAVLTGTYTGLEKSLESIIRGTGFDEPYRNAKNKIRVSTDEKYKLDMLVQEMKYLESDFSKLQQEIVQAGCEKAGNVSIPGACRTAGQTCGPNAQCCTGLTCTNGVCRQSASCIRDGLPATLAAQCCSGYRDSRTGLCGRSTCPDEVLRTSYSEALQAYRNHRPQWIAGSISNRNFQRNYINPVNNIVRQINNACQSVSGFVRYQEIPSVN